MQIAKGQILGLEASAWSQARKREAIKSGELFVARSFCPVKLKIVNVLFIDILVPADLLAFSVCVGIIGVDVVVAVLACHESLELVGAAEGSDAL